jgi:hypothetical protein
LGHCRRPGLVSGTGNNVLRHSVEKDLLGLLANHTCHSANRSLLIQAVKPEATQGNGLIQGHCIPTSVSNSDQQTRNLHAMLPTRRQQDPINKFAALRCLVCNGVAQWRALAPSTEA